MNTIIRSATKKDADAVAACLLLAMEDIIGSFLGTEDREEALRFMEHFAGREDNQYSYQNCLVAELGARVVGALNVYDGGGLVKLREPILDHIRKYYNPEFAPVDETQKGEYYIDSLGVLPEMQGLGIGSMLLKFLIESHVVQKGHTLGLLVDDKNPGARKLYEKLGFKVAGSKTLAGKGMAHMQIGV
jgi:ribosomal protein S18 acetylase RimI-like enzyme